MNVYYNKYLILISSHGREKKFQSCQKRRFIHYSKNPPISKKRETWKRAFKKQKIEKLKLKAHIQNL